MCACTGGMNVNKRQRSPVGPSSGQNEEKASAPAAIQNVCCQPVDCGTPIGTVGTTLDVLNRMAHDLKACANVADSVACRIADAEDSKGIHVSDEECWSRLQVKVNEARPTPLSVLKDLPCQAYHNKAAFAAGAVVDLAKYVTRKVYTMCSQQSSKIDLEVATDVMEALEYMWQWAVISGTAPECQAVVDKAAATWAVARVVCARVRYAELLQREATAGRLMLNRDFVNQYTHCGDHGPHFVCGDYGPQFAVAEEVEDDEVIGILSDLTSP
jgi:hypothetical protein